MQVAEGNARFGNVVACRSRECPVCSISRRAKLAHEIAHVVSSFTAETKKFPWLFTMTVRHSAEDPVAICRAVRECWRKMIGKRAWSRFREQCGIEFVIAEEITRGDNGWHPHLHALLLPRRNIGDPVERSGLLFEEWETAVTRELGAEHAPDLAHGVDLRPCHVSRYLTKLGVELTDSGAVKGRAPLALLQAGGLELYMELQIARKGARDFSWSKALGPWRKSMPPPPPSVVKLRLRAMEFGLLHARGHDACLQVLTAAAAGEDAQRVAERYVGRLSEPQEFDDLVEFEVAPDDAPRDQSIEAALAGLGVGRRAQVPDVDGDALELELLQLEQRVWLQERRRRVVDGQE